LENLATACLALLPPQSPGDEQGCALLFECGFEGPFSDFASALFARAGEDLSAVLRHCEGYSRAANAREFSQYLSQRAVRASTLAEPRGSAGIEFWPRLRAVFAPLRLLFLRRGTGAALSAEQLEERRGAVGMQEPRRGVPLLHLAWLSARPNALTRTKRALRAVAGEPAPVQDCARFLVHHGRLLFLAYPQQSAALWSERMSHVACFKLARIWANTRGFPALPLLRRARRERRLQEFLLDNRLPVAVWFNAASALPRT
jgi:hypothetical protein